MHLTSHSFADGDRLPDRLAFCRPDPQQHATFSDNLNPHLAFGDLPPGTRSLAVVCHDPDVPSRGDDVNQEDRTVPHDLPRVDFCHWLLVDLDPAVGEIAEGSFSSGVTPRGKPGPGGPLGTRQGVNDYTGWFAADPQMAGDYHGYDGPCPPWNDERLHHYVFTAYALDVARAPIEGRFLYADLLQALRPHVLAQAQITGTYSLNPAVR